MHCVVRLRVCATVGIAASKLLFGILPGQFASGSVVVAKTWRQKIPACWLLWLGAHSEGRHRKPL